ncbi:MAG: FAD binding domain-containing protein [Acetobacteraceae bacterium]
MTTHETLLMADTIADACAALADRGAAGAFLAGGTWVMRAPLRHETHAPFYVGIGRIPELNVIDIEENQIRIGACVTHAQLAARLANVAPCNGLTTAARSAANPAIREMATIGGNLWTWDFPAADLPPALLCLDAELELHTPSRQQRLPIEHFLKERRNLEPGTLLTQVIVPRRPVRTGHARLPLRKAGDYPVVIVSMAAILAANRVADDIRVAVGSLETSPLRWPQLERQLVGRPLDPRIAHDLAAAEATSFAARDSVEAPGWYRLQVLPALVRGAAEAVLAGQ